MSKIGSVQPTAGPTSEPGPTEIPGTTLPPPEGMSRTVIFIKAQSAPGQDGFIRGGISHDHRTGNYYGIFLLNLKS